MPQLECVVIDPCTFCPNSRNQATVPRVVAYSFRDGDGGWRFWMKCDRPCADAGPRRQGRPTRPPAKAQRCPTSTP